MPVLLHGLELGAILAGRLFHEGIGDGLLLWYAPANANQVLRSTLMRWARLEQLLLKGGDERKSAADYIRELEQGGVVEVEGYEWSSRLWHASFGLELPTGLADIAAATSAPSKPVRMVELGKAAALLVKGGTPAFDELRDFDWLYSENMNWLSAKLARPKGNGQVIDTANLRQLISLDGNGTTFRGTYHKVPDDRGLPRSELIQKPRLGIFFLNSLTLPRAATGDSAIYWADSFASLRVPILSLRSAGFGGYRGRTFSQFP